MSIFYDVVSVFAVVSGILVITTSSPVVSVLFLICVFVSVASYLIILGIGFIGISYIVVYVGAVAVLMLFVIMMINMRLAELSTIGTAYTKSMPISFMVGFAMFYQLFSIIPKEMNGSMNTLGVINSFTSYLNPTSLGISESLTLHEVYNSMVPDTIMSTNISLQIHNVGTILYSTTPIWLMLISIILLLAMVSPIVISRR